MTMKDIFDLNPELTVSDVERNAEETDNPHLEDYYRECIARKQNDE